MVTALNEWNPVVRSSLPSQIHDKLYIIIIIINDYVNVVLIMLKLPSHYIFDMIDFCFV